MARKRFVREFYEAIRLTGEEGRRGTGFARRSERAEAPTSWAAEPGFQPNSSRTAAPPSTSLIGRPIGLMNSFCGSIWSAWYSV